jgi:DNA-binding SARP family transcriptional activator/TolB-like protein
MLELRLLGTLDLRTPDGLEIRSILAQPKRVALLAYLALQAPGGYVRRDTLLALFWPEAATESARGSLRNSLSYLRRSLGAPVVVTRGAEEVGIDPALLQCDAVQFLRDVESGHAGRALARYHGDLLPGFFLSGTPEFDHWLDGERTRLKERAGEAAWRLAEESEGAGRRDEAVQLARRAVALCRDEEAAVRRLMALFGRLGDRRSALRTYETYAERLWTEYEVTPSAETQALHQSIRIAGGEVPGAQPQKVTPPAATAPPVVPPLVATPGDAGGDGGDGDDVGDGAPGPDAARGPEPPARGPSAGAAPRRRTVPYARVVLLVVAVGLATVAAALLLRPRPADPPALGNAVAVFPFAYRGSGETAYLGEGIVWLLSTNLNGAGELRSVDPRALLSEVDRSRGAARDAAWARAQAGRFGASMYVMGHILEAGGRLRITATLHDSADGARPGEVTVQGDSGDLLQLVDQLTVLLLAGHHQSPPDRLARLAALTTHSLTALRHYLEGESEYRSGRYATAVEALQRAVAADSSFALAQYRLSTAAQWTEGGLVGPAAKRALRHSGRLSERDRRLVEAWHSYVAGDPLHGERLYRAALAEYPDDVEAWLQLGETLFHWGPSVGRPAAEARYAFERVVFYEPTNAGALIHLARIAGDEDRIAALDSLTNRAIALQPQNVILLQVRALQAFALGRRSDQERILDAVAALDPDELERIVVRVASHTGDLPGAMELARLLGSDAAPPLQRGQTHLRLAQLELAQGRWRSAQAELRNARAFLRPHAIEMEAGWTLLPFLSPTRPELEALRATLASLPTAGSLDREDTIPPFSRVYVPRQLYLLGVLGVRLEEPAAAREHADRLERYRGVALDTAFSRYFAGVARARMAWSRGDAAEALRQLGEPRILPDRTLPVLGTYIIADERFLRAELLRALGREDEALRVFASFPDPEGYDLHYLALSHLGRARIHDARGDAGRAATHYRRFIALWADADPELQPLVLEARARLDGLE